MYDLIRILNYSLLHRKNLNILFDAIVKIEEVYITAAEKYFIIILDIVIMWYFWVNLGNRKKYLTKCSHSQHLTLTIDLTWLLLLLLILSVLDFHRQLANLFLRHHHFIWMCVLADSTLFWDTLCMITFSFVTHF